MLEGEIEMCGELSKVGCIEMRLGVDGKVGDLGVWRRMVEEGDEERVGGELVGGM